MGHIRFEMKDGIAEMTMSWPGAVNLIDDDFVPSFREVLDKLHAEGDALKGAIILSNKKTFFAGADLKRFALAPETPAEDLFAMVQEVKGVLREIERLGKPVVAVIEGAAMGGGWEVALACHHRVALDDPALRMALPEVQLGLLPGAGGVTRMVRHLGVEQAMPYLLQGKPLKPADVERLGLAELAANHDDALEKARSFIAANPAAKAPWDAKGYKIPGGAPYMSPRMMQTQVASPAILTKTTRGTMPAPEAILATAVEGAHVDFDTALRIETRYLVSLLRNPISRAMTTSLFTDLNDLKAGAARPNDSARTKIKTLGVLGAGMMGAGIAYAAAIVGIEVRLLDTDMERAEKGKDYSDKILAKRVARKRMTEDAKAQILSRITPVTDYQTLDGCDLIIEAVFEDPKVKADVIAKSEPMLAETGIFGSNTSTLPISELAQSSRHADRFIGLHFFSPVDKMQLVEIIRGKETSDETATRSVDFVTQIGKIPIVVNDSRGFFTSRVFGQFVNEGATMLSEGIPAAAVENAARQAGMPVGPLAILDEVTLTLPLHVEKSARDAGVNTPRHPGMEVLEKMVAAGRTGRSAGKGFYDYNDKGEKRLSSEVPGILGVDGKAEFDLEELKDRILYAQAIDAMRVKEAEVLTSPRELNIGSIFGIGFPAWTGGVHSYVSMIGQDAFQRRADELAERHGERFKLPENWSL